MKSCDILIIIFICLIVIALIYYFKSMSCLATIPLLITGGSTSNTNSNNIKVMSFNVLAQVWIDDPLKNITKSKYLDKFYRVKKQVETIKDVNPDILFLQEVTPSTLNKYLDQLPNYFVPPCFARMSWIPHNDYHAINGNAIMWKKDLFKTYKCQTVVLDQKHGNRISVVTATLKENNKSIKLICCHFTWGNPDIAAEQFRNIFRHNIMTKTVDYGIIAGDFNMGNNDIKTYPIINDIKKYGFSDPINGKRTHPFMEDLHSSISHILPRGFKNIKNIKIGHSSNIEECLRIYGSDHFPVSLTLDL